MKKVLFFIISLLTMFSISAQTHIGKFFFDLKDYELAKKCFQQKLSENSGEAYYYLGEIAFAEGNLDDATHYFNQGLQTNAEPFCKVGIAKIHLKKGQKPEATTIFLSLQRRYSGDMDILTAIGYAYLDNKLYQDLESHLKDMQKVNNKEPRIYVLEGDMLKAQDRIGAVTGKYEMALYFDPNFDLATIKLVEVYERSNWQIAAEKLIDLLERNPNYTIAYRYLGRIYTMNGYWQKAIDAYKTFFAAGNVTLEDISRFAQALFFSKNYDEANEKIKEGLKIAPNHFVLNRLQMYVAAHTLNIEAGLKYADYFFSLRKDQPSEYITLDYSTYALLLKEAKMYDEAIEQYKKTLLMDSNAIDFYKEMATIATLKGNSGLAGDYYKIYIEKKGTDKVGIMDFFDMGKYYYSASAFRNASDTARVLTRYKDVDFAKTLSENEQQKDSLMENQQLFIEKALKYYMNQADKAFDAVIELNPESYQGVLWKARTNSLMDPESEIGLAKPFYEKVAELLSEREDRLTPGIIRNSLIEANSYLAYFYYLQKDNPNVRIFCEKLLELDSENKTALELLKHIK
jgi:tetratricopeptide (TPR) repeat protein